MRDPTAGERTAWQRLSAEFAKRAHHCAESNATITISLPATDWPVILAGAVAASPPAGGPREVGEARTDLRSVVYRDGPLTLADYDEAIEALHAGRSQLEGAGNDGRGCAVCYDDMHLAWCCWHNPLVLARLYGALPGAQSLNAGAPWRCYHCNETFATSEEAGEHFGKSEHEVARCIEARAAAPRGEAGGPSEDAVAHATYFAIKAARSAGDVVAHSTVLRIVRAALRAAATAPVGETE